MLCVVIMQPAEFPVVTATTHDWKALEATTLGGPLLPPYGSGRLKKGGLASKTTN